jgi:hypothetical protein
MLRIAFLALSQAHQFLHWIPAALRLAREPGVEVTVIGASRAGLNFIRSYDKDGLLRFRKLWVPRATRDSLFTTPKRKWALRMHHREIGRYQVIVTTETTSSLLYDLPGFQSKMIHLKHGAGDREGGYNPKHAHFDLTLVHGPKDKQRLIARGLATEDNCVVVGYGKFELTPPAPPQHRQRRMALYNPHFDPAVSSWFSHGRKLVEAMGQIPEWDFVVAPHVKTRDRLGIRSRHANVAIDMGSVRSIDMTYLEQADIYIGEASSQVYEFIRRPRPCIFLNFGQIDWREAENYAHWKFGQVIERPEDLRSALQRADELQPGYEAAQRAALAQSIDTNSELASERQARAILAFAREMGVSRFAGAPCQGKELAAPTPPARPDQEPWSSWTAGTGSTGGLPPFNAVEFDELETPHLIKDSPAATPESEEGAPAKHAARLRGR